ncbi:MAG: DUF3299 domain-containing protein [Phycisphaerae bacterium]
MGRLNIVLSVVALSVLALGAAVLRLRSEPAPPTSGTLVRGAPISGAAEVPKLADASPVADATMARDASATPSGARTQMPRQEATDASMASPPPSAPAANAAPSRPDGAGSTPQPTAGDSKADPSASGGLVPFSVLAAFTYDPYARFDAPAGQMPPEQIPEKIRALSGRAVTIEGFMMPIEMHDDLVRTFLLVRNRMMCCFGMQVAMNEWVLVKMREGDEARFYNDVPLHVHGKLEVGEDVQDGMVMSLYRMRADEVTPMGGY